MDGAIGWTRNIARMPPGESASLSCNALRFEGSWNRRAPLAVAAEMMSPDRSRSHSSPSPTMNSAVAPWQPSTQVPIRAFNLSRMKSLICSIFQGNRATVMPSRSNLAGRTFQISRRRSSLIDRHELISDGVRPHPRQRLVSSSSRHTPVQGLGRGVAMAPIEASPAKRRGCQIQAGAESLSPKKARRLSAPCCIRSISCR